MTGPEDTAVWVLADPRAGTAAQAIGIAERLGVPFRSVPLAWGPLARLPWPMPTLMGLAAKSRALFRPPWPRLVLSAGRRSAPVALWLGRRGVRTVHCMRPGFGAAGFDLLVLGRHDPWPDPAAPNLLRILGATHRVSPERLAAEGAAWAEAFAPLPRPRVALLLGGPVRAEGMDPATAAGIGQRAAALGASVLATASRRTGATATEALARVLAPVPHRLHRWGAEGPNPYPGLLAWADAVVVTGDSVSMLSEALMAPAPVWIADPGGLGLRHRALAESLVAAGQARHLGEGDGPFARPAALDETGRVARAILDRGWVAAAPPAGSA